VEQEEGKKKKGRGGKKIIGNHGHIREQGMGAPSTWGRKVNLRIEQCTPRKKPDKWGEDQKNS